MVDALNSPALPCGTSSIGAKAPVTDFVDGNNGAIGGGESFKNVLLKNLNEVNKLQQDADTSLNNYVTGKTENVGEVISASQKAGMAFSMLVQIRNKLQDAYDELKNLRV